MSYLGECMELMFVLKKLNSIFQKEGYKLWAVGGTVRDFLLGKEVSDFDFATDATPLEMQQFLDKIETQFAKFGIIIYKIDNIKVQFATLRKECGYLDYRHPKNVEFVKNLEEDFYRRDFTINAIYLDCNEKIYDFCHGLDDLKSHTLRMIGDVDLRLKEDPLRIMRAIRFARLLDFNIEKELKGSILRNSNLLKNINPQKIQEEIKKMNFKDELEAKEYLEKFNINLFN